MSEQVTDQLFYLCLWTAIVAVGIFVMDQWDK